MRRRARAARRRCRRSPHRRPPWRRPLSCRRASSRYQHAIDVAAADGLTVWLEADLVKRWLAGPASFSAAVAQIAQLSSHDVVGIKVADELGYHDGLSSPGMIRRFLTDTAAALHRAVPGRLILADIVVPELACLPGWTLAPVSTVICAARARAAHPSLQIAEVTGYLRLHALDVVDLSADLLSDRTYHDWGSSQLHAQQLAWRVAAAAGWPSLVRLQARHAFAHPGAYRVPAGPTAMALRTFIEAPVREGATGVDVWTWDAFYRGRTVTLTDPGVKGNALWAGLKRERSKGISLITHFSPTYVQRDVATDVRALSAVFRQVFIAAGTG